MSTPQLSIINTMIREIIKKLDEAKQGRATQTDVLQSIDELEDSIDAMIRQLAPERITDERFKSAVNAVNDLSKKTRELRETVLAGRYTYAKKKVLDVQSSVRSAYRLLMLIQAGAPTPFIFQVSPQYLREELLTAPESLVLSSPMASQIYNILVRKGEVSVEELAMELKIDKETREDFNRAITHLIASGYAKPCFTEDNRMILRIAKR